MNRKNNVWGKWIYWFVYAVAVITVYKTLDNFSDITNWIKEIFNILMPFIIGIFLAYLFYVPCKNIEKLYKKSKIKIIKNKSRLLSVFTVYLIAIVILIIGINFILPAITTSISDLLNNIDNYYNSTIKEIETFSQDSILRKIDIKKILEELKNINIEQYFNLELLTQYAKGAIGIANGIFDFFVSIIVSIYVLLERNSILNFLKKFIKAIFKKKTCEVVRKYFYASNSIFFKFLSSQLLDAIIVGILTSIAMLILGVKYAILLGLMIGISNLIPYFGAIIGVGLSIIITIFTGGISQAIWLAIIVIILQQIDANIINPKIVGNSLEISPLLVIFSVTIGGAYFGILGMFLAVPIFTVLKIMIGDYIEYKSKINKEENAK
ncbi:MAG: AI-2E family transporter [Clostridia bacterium]|jgi:predicted PurR-regulated permease PerM|nr:AI-2E family transporter [Clostridia bacterium]